jgi:uncharacterized membrane protein YfcA
MTIITDPLFYLFAVPAVVFLGLAKGGFSGVGMISTPLLALVMSPLEAAALLLPILLVQDAFSVWIYRRVWDPWNLKVLIPGAVIGVGATARSTATGRTPQAAWSGARCRASPRR